MFGEIYESPVTNPALGVLCVSVYELRQVRGKRAANRVSCTGGRKTTRVYPGECNLRIIHSIKCVGRRVEYCDLS